MNFYNSRIIILTYFQIETIFDDIAENSSCCECGETKESVYCMYTSIYIIIRHCPGVGAFPRPFCVPNSVALASLTLQVGDWAIH